MHHLPRTKTISQHAARSVTAVKIKGLLFAAFTPCRQGTVECYQIRDTDTAVNLKTAET